MLTIVDKAIAGFVVPAVMWALTSLLGVELSAEFAVGLTSIFTAIAVYVVPNKA